MTLHLTPTQLDRAAGALVGLAAGDALGAGYEFGPAFSTAPEMIGGGIGSWDSGEWTDDTQMALCIAEVTATGCVDVDAIGDHFLQWLEGGPKDVGIQTRAVLSGAKHGRDLPASAASHFEHNPRGAAGNGSLMRTAPLALAHLGDDAAIEPSAMAVSQLTHGDPLAGEACVLWCIAIDRAVREGRLDGVNDGIALLPASSRDRWREIIDVAESSPPDSFSPNGFVIPAFQAAYAAICQTPIPERMPCLHLQRALERAVQIGNDTDTVAAVAGQLLGARWGASAVPLRWRRLLHGWPNYRSRDLTRLAVLSARGEAPDVRAWPVVERMVPSYRRDFAVTGDSFALADDAGVRIGDVATIEGDDSDVVVSLCRTGRCDVREGAEHLEVWLIDEVDPEHNPNLEFILRDIATTVVGCRDEGKSVLLHCVRAESRTPTVAAAYLCERLGLTADQALARVRKSLPRMNPNRGFVAALQQAWPSR
ncbi:MAG: ADP-ribosylglycohydrolase family protein [Actinomycetota bacterium]|nr:ADP-ribosylglycohydrolase family protein [Actinomycetota bacterium]